MSLSEMTNDTLRRMGDVVLAARRASGGWGYRTEGTIGVEPTALAALALHAAAAESAIDVDSRTIAGAADKLAACQQPDGALGVTETMTTPHWATAWGAILWNIVGTHAESCGKAIGWLTAHQGNTDLYSTGGPFSHNSTIPGWPWVLGTQSWLEPTALAAIALCAFGERDHSRARQGRELIRDRAIRSGGWNYGNSQVFGADLRAQPVPTALAILALTIGGENDLPCLDRGCAYLERTLPGTRAPQSLGWGILGLAACDRRPAEADLWLTEAFEKIVSRPDPGFPTALLLLAAARGTLVAPAQREVTRQ
jgi:hypothetical protein